MPGRQQIAGRRFGVAGRGWGAAVCGVLICAFVCLSAGAARAEALDEPAATALVEQFVAVAAQSAPSFGGAAERFASEGFRSEGAGRMTRDGGETIVSAPVAGKAGPFVMTFALQDWYGLLVVFEDELAERFGVEAVERVGDALPAVYKVEAGETELMFSFLPGERDGAKLIGLVAASFQ